MDEDIAYNIVESGIDTIAFSLAGPDAESNACRQGIDFNHLDRSIQTLQAVRRNRVGVHLEIHFAYLLLVSKMEAVYGLPALMQRLGVHASVVSTLGYIPAPGLAEEAIHPKNSEKRNRATAILEKTAAEAEKLDLGFHFALPHPDSTGTTCDENISRSFYVSADGSVSPCVYLNVPVKFPDTNRRIFGNIRKNDPLQIWETQAFKNFRDHLATGDPDMPCRTCLKRLVR
jgi:radical SAM protein with 4Fe4S-binding SPASM domain